VEVEPVEVVPEPMVEPVSVIVPVEVVPVPVVEPVPVSSADTTDNVAHMSEEATKMARSVFFVFIK
jgi:hypothetical protein